MITFNKPNKPNITPTMILKNFLHGTANEQKFINICDLVKHLTGQKEITATTSTSADIIEEEITNTKEEISKDEVIPHNIFKHPQNQPLAVIGKPALYVRESYEEFYHLLVNWASKGSNHKFLITGAPGIGKSCFLIYFLIQLLCESKNVTIIFQSLQSEEFYCFENLNLSSGSYDDFSVHFQSSETWYLADGITSPKLVPAKTVVALSPKGVFKDEFQAFEKGVVKKLYISPWSLEELSFCRKYVFPNVPEEIMLAIYDKAGGVPGYVFRRVELLLKYDRDPETPLGKEIIVKKAFERVEYCLVQVKNFDDLILCFIENDRFIQYSSCLIHRCPNLYYNGYYLQWASRYIYDEIQKRLDDSWDSLLKRIQMMENFPTVRGIMFEMYVIHLFQTSNDQFAMEELLESSDEKDPEYKKFSIVNKSSAISYIRTAKELSTITDNKIVLPDISNFGAANLFYTPNMIFQVTVSDNHPIKQVELIKIVENMPAYKKNVPIDLVFVVPGDIHGNYKYQDIVTKDTDTNSFQKVKKQDTKLKNVRQWVLYIDVS